METNPRPEIPSPEEMIPWPSSHGTESSKDYSDHPRNLISVDDDMEAGNINDELKGNDEGSLEEQEEESEEEEEIQLDYHHHFHHQQQLQQPPPQQETPPHTFIDHQNFELNADYEENEEEKAITRTFSNKRYHELNRDDEDSEEEETLPETCSNHVNSSIQAELSESSGHFSSESSDASSHKRAPREWQSGTAGSVSECVYMKIEESSSSSDPHDQKEAILGQPKTLQDKILQFLLVFFFFLLGSCFTAMNVIKSTEIEENISVKKTPLSQSPSFYPTLVPTIDFLHKPSSLPSLEPLMNATSDGKIVKETSNVSTRPILDSTTSWEIIGNELYGGSYLTHFGYSIAISNEGNILAISEYGEDTKQIFIYEIMPSGSVWMLMDVLQGPLSSEFGSSVSMSDDGTKIAVGGAHYENRGIVRVYGRNRESKWLQVGSDIWGKTYDTNFGASVSLSGDGDKLAVGASLGDYAQIYKWDENSWTKLGRELLGTAGTSFGSSISISLDGYTVAIGALDGQYVEVFELKDSAWSSRGSKILGSLYSTDNTNFGDSVALSKSGDVLVVGAPGDGEFVKGIVHAFEWNGESYITRGGELRGVSENYNVGSSICVSQDGSYIAYDVYENTENGAGVHVFNWKQSSWYQLSNPIKGGESYIKLALSGSGDTLAVGSASDDILGNNTRKVTVYKRLPP